MTEKNIQNMTDLPIFVSVPILAKLFGISQSSCYELMHEKGFPSLRIGSRIVVPRDKLIEWIDSRVGQ